MLASIKVRSVQARLIYVNEGWSMLETTAWYCGNRDGFLERNEGYVFGGYGEQVRRFLFALKDSRPFFGLVRFSGVLMRCGL